MSEKIYEPPLIPLPQGRRIAVGDVHGCFYTLQALLEKVVKITLQDQIFILGDCINRGNDSAKVLDYLMELQAQQFAVFTIRGNHEEKFLMAYGCGMPFFVEFLEHYNSTDLLDGDMHAYLDFCNQSLYCCQSGDFYLSHLGFSQQTRTPANDTRLLFPKAKITISNQDLNSKRSIHGHFVKNIEDIEKAVQQNFKDISLDGGCVSGLEEGFGYLCALDLDSMELHIQENIEE